MAITESFEKGMRLGIAIRGLRNTQAEREKARKERQEIRAEDLKYKEAQEARAAKLGEQREKEFEWKEEDREKKKRYEIINQEFGVVKALHDAGLDREAAAKLSNLYNKRWPDGNESMVVFRSDTTNPQLRAKWDNDPNLAGKEIGVLSRTGGILPFKTMKDLMKYSAAKLNQTEYLKSYKTAEANIVRLNAQEKPFRAKDGFNYANLGDGFRWYAKERANSTIQGKNTSDRRGAGWLENKSCREGNWRTINQGGDKASSVRDKTAKERKSCCSGKKAGPV
jgi:hypothetical protein